MPQVTAADLFQLFQAWRCRSRRFARQVRPGVQARNSAAARGGAGAGRGPRCAAAAPIVISQPRKIDTEIRPRRNREETARLYICRHDRSHGAGGFSPRAAGLASKQPKPMNLVTIMSNSHVFGSPMILTGRKPVSPFGAATSVHSDKPAAATSRRRLLRSLRGLLAPSARERRIRTTVMELSKLDDRMLRDIGLDRSAIISAANEADGRTGRRFHG